MVWALPAASRTRTRHRRRLDGLSAAARAVVALALVGDPLPVPVLLAGARRLGAGPRGVDERGVDEAVDEARAAGLLELGADARATVPGRLLRECLLADLPLAERRAAHAALAGVLDSRHRAAAARRAPAGRRREPARAADGRVGGRRRGRAPGRRSRRDRPSRWSGPPNWLDRPETRPAGWSGRRPTRWPQAVSGRPNNCCAGSLQETAAPAPRGCGCWCRARSTCATVPPPPPTGG